MIDSAIKKPSKLVRVADYFADFLAQRGIDTTFMVSGGMMMHLMDAVGRDDRFRLYFNHHEQASAMAADAYARVTGRPGFCLATGGPGGTNVLTGLVGAYQDSIPLIFLTGQSKVCDTVRGNNIPGLRQFGFLEVDLVPIVESVTKYAAFVHRAQDARFHMEKAYYLATHGRPGPVLLDVPLDIQGAMIDPDTLPGFEAPTEASALTPQNVAKILKQLQAAKKPLILAGHGIRCAGAVTSFRKLVDALEIPVAITQLGKDVLPYAHPLFVGHPGVKGNRAANITLQDADLLLVIGSSLHGQTIGWESELFAPTAHKIHVDPDPAILQKTKGIVTEQLQADVSELIEALTKAVASQSLDRTKHASWRDRCRELKNLHSPMSEPHKLGPKDGPANLYEIVDIVSDIVPANTILLSDSGQSTYVVPQALRQKDSHRYLAPGSLAEMGWALPAAIGAAAADPKNTVFAFVGDGSLQTNIQELQTIRHTGFNIKILVINNDGYASIRGTQDRFFSGNYVGSTRESGITLPELQRIAHAYDIPYLSCPNRGDLSDCIQKMMAHSGPVICEVAAMRDQDIIPAVTSVKLPDGRMRSAPLQTMSPLLPEKPADEACTPALR